MRNMILAIVMIVSAGTAYATDFGSLAVSADDIKAAAKNTPVVNVEAITKSPDDSAPAGAKSVTKGTRVSDILYKRSGTVIEVFTNDMAAVKWDNGAIDTAYIPHLGLAIPALKGFSVGKRVLYIGLLPGTVTEVFSNHLVAWRIDLDGRTGLSHTSDLALSIE